MSALTAGAAASSAYHRVGRAVRAWSRVGAVLAVVSAWPSDGAAPSGEELPQGGAACFAGDAGCRNDAFTLAAALLAADEVAHVVIGRVVHVENLPETLGERRVVEASLEVRNVRKPPGRCPFSVRFFTRDNDYCEEAPMPRLLTLRIPSDWFLWPATGTSRRVARRAGRHLAALASLERERAAGRVNAREHEEGKARLEGLVREALDVAEGDAGVARLLEDRRVHVEIGVEYLFALGPERQGADGPYHLPRTPKAGADWHVFAGSERDDMDVALRGVGSCLNESHFLEPPTVENCMILARGRAKYTSVHPHMRRH